MKKALFLFLAIILVVSAFPISSAFAATAAKEVYLDGTNGKDTNTGADAANAVATIKKAVELLPNGGTIIVSGDTAVDSTGDDSTAFGGVNIILPAHNGTIHIKGVKKNDGTYTKLLKTAPPPATHSHLSFSGDVVISDVVIQTTERLFICMRGHDLTMGYNISVEKDPLVANSGVWIYGFANSGADAGTDVSAYTYNQTINIYSGDYDLITGTGASAAMKLNGTDTTLQKVTGDIVINLYGGKISGPNSKLLSSETSGEVTGNVTVNLYKGVEDFDKINYYGQSTRISGDSVLNMYNFTAAEEEAIKAKIVATSIYTKVNGSLTGTIPTPAYLTPTTPTTTDPTTTAPVTGDAGYIIGIFMALSFITLFVAYTQRKKSFGR